jgi:hypothetical protein
MICYVLLYYYCVAKPLSYHCVPSNLAINRDFKEHRRPNSAHVYT